MSANLVATDRPARSDKRPTLRDWLAAPLCGDFPARPEADENTFRLTRRMVFGLIGLVFLTIAPRILLAFRLDAVCDDAYYYISVADAWDRADVEAALQYLNINIYPLILWGLHSIGFDWVLGGQVWGICVSGLTILPLFGLVRRLYDDRVAAAACFLFAVHPELIEASIEPIRGPTFWLFFVLSLYTMWRAIAGNSLRWYVATAACMTLAIHTRAEGWILLVPLGLWTVLLRRPREEPRKSWISFLKPRATFLKTVLGTAVVVAGIPGFVVATNLTLLKDRDDWEWGRFTHFRNFYEWVKRDVSKENIHVSERKPRPWSIDLIEPSTTAAKPRAAAPPKPHPQGIVKEQPAANPPPAKLQPPPPAEVTPEVVAAATPLPGPPPEAVSNPLTDGRGYTYLNHFVRKFEPINLILMLFGLCGWWRVLFRRDKFVLLVVCVGLLTAIWIRIAQIGDMNGRYFLSPFLVCLPFAGVGLVWALHRLAKLAESLKRRSPMRVVAAPMSLLLALTTFGYVDSITATHKQRRAQAKLGQWLNRELGPFDSVLVDRAATRVGYFAHGTMPTVSYYFSSSGDGREYAMPDLLIVTRKLSKPHERVYLYGEVARMQLQPVNVEVIPDTSQGYLVFAKRQPRSKTYYPKLAERDAQKRR